MARLRTVASATGTLRPSHDARYNRAQLFVHPRSETNQIAPISWMEREKIFVRRFQVRIQTCVRFSKALGRLATFEIRFEIDQSEDDEGYAMFFSPRASK